MILKLLLLSTIGFSQVDMSHTKFCHPVTKLIEQLAKNPANRGTIKRACTHGEGKAFFQLKEKNNRLPDIAKNNLAKRGCDMGYTPACVYVSNNIKKSVNPQKTLRDLKSGCVDGNVSACASLGIIHKREKKYTQALKSFNFACESGDGESCYMMGKIYELQGRVQSALKMHKYACTDKKTARSCLVIGKDLQKNRPTDKKAIYFYLNKACSDGIEEGCFLLDKL